MKDIITYPDFEKLDIRIGQILEAEAPEWSQKLLKFSVDFGDEIGIKTILSGVKEWYSSEDFINKKFMFIVNLTERQMGKSVSQGMMLMADEDEKPVPIPVDNNVKIGTIIR